MTAGTGGGGPAWEPVARPGPAPSSPALSTPGSGARRSHDLWGRGCRSERAGEPGRSGNKGPGKRGGGGSGLPAQAAPPPTSVGPRRWPGSGEGDGRLWEAGSASHPVPELSPAPRCMRGRGARATLPSRLFPHPLGSGIHDQGVPQGWRGTRGLSPASSLTAAPCQTVAGRGSDV